MDLLEEFKKFFNKNFDKNKPILLAYSGGTDSSCLLDLLLKYRDVTNIDLHVAHVDHGWREESRLEALEIEKKMKKLNVFFHLKKLKLDNRKNLENESRIQRFLFFKTLFKEYGFQAVILAHHKDDLAETVLKRFLEGANIFSLTSMQKISSFETLTIFRPLLEISKKDIMHYLHLNNINYYMDSSNKNTKFLRAKMRIDIFPFLQKNFNKNILDNLAQVSSYSSELNDYLDVKTSKVFKKMKTSPFGLYIDLNEINESLELKYILKKIARVKNLDLSRNVLKQLVVWIFEKKPNLRLNIKNANIYIDRGSFFILNMDNKSLKKSDLAEKNNNKSLNLGSFDFDIWQVDVSKINPDWSNPDWSNLDWVSNWKSLFINELYIFIPEGKFYIDYPGPSKYLKKLWENQKVPAFLRKAVPIIYSENKATYDFLSGKKNKLNDKKILKIVIKLK